MESEAIRALAARVETEEPSEALRAAVLTAFGSEAEPGSAPNPLRSVDDAKAFQPEGFRVFVIDKGVEWCCILFGSDKYNQEANAPTEPRARTAASLRALAWEMENAG